MPDPLRSPKQSRVAAKSKGHPYSRPANHHRTRDAGVPRSNSLLGTIKSFVTAPLAWLSLGDAQDPNDPRPKRRIEGSERGGTPPRAKRARRNSPEAAGYLDPPDSIFASGRASIPFSNNSNVIRTTMSIDPPEPTHVSLPLSRGHSILSRASMSVEPQGSSTLRRSTTRDFSIPPPSPFARSYSRSSLTPQPAGATFGPSPKRKPRESTAPPLLGPSLTPSFTRPPTSTGGQQNLFPRAPLRHRSEGPISSLLGNDRQSISPVRETPTMLTHDENLVSRLSSKNTAERTLSTLESFRTPLHVARFPSAPLAEEHRPRKVHVPVPSKLRFDHTPEGRKDKAKRPPTIVGPYSSGMSGMRKLLTRRREELEREKAEVEVEAETEPDHVPSLSEEAETEYEVQERRNGKGKAKEIELELENNLPEPPKTRLQANGVAAKAAAPRSKPDGPYSTLRAPTGRVSRTHAPAPQLKKTRNKFSLEDEDDEQEWMSVEEIKSYQAQAVKVQPPISFATVRRMSEAAMQTDMDNSPRAASPPLPAQPQTFDSLLSRIGPPTSASAKPSAQFPSGPEQLKPSVEVPPAPATNQTKVDGQTIPKPDVQSISQPVAQAAPKLDGPSQPQFETSSAHATLPFSFGTPTPTAKPIGGVASPFASASTTPVPSPAPTLPISGPGGVPSFFANTKAQFTPPKVPTGSLFSSGEKKDGTEQPKNTFGQAQQKQTEKETQKETKPSPFGGVTKPSAFGSGPPSGNSTTGTSTGAASPFSGFGNIPSGEAPKPASPFGAPAVDSTDASKPGIRVFGAGSKSDTNTSTSIAAPPSGSPFTFGAPPVTKPNVNPVASTTDTPSKPSFSFGAPPAAPAPSVETPKPLFTFGTSASTQSKAPPPEASKSPFSFGAAPSTPPPADKTPAFTFGGTSNTGASGFSFGSGTSSNGAVNGTSLDAPKPLFGGFGSGNTMAATSSAPKTPEPPAEGGNEMEMNGDRMEESPTRTVDKKDTLAPQVSQSSSFAGFGSDGTGFSFGQDKPATSSFSFSQSKPAVSSGFTFGQASDKPTGTSSTSTGFGFGSDTTKTTGQSQPPFGAPTNNPFGGTSSTPTSSPSFTFGQPSANSNINASPFGQPQQPETGTSSAPGSPSLFPQTTAQQPQSPSFSFNASPANTFPSSNTGAATPSSPTVQPFQFGAPSGASQQQPSAAGGSNMFTLGGAATPPRKVKGLPTRRGKR